MAKDTKDDAPPSQPGSSITLAAPAPAAVSAAQAPVLVTEAAKQLPSAASMFSLTPHGAESIRVKALDETDAVATWLEKTGTPASTRRVAVSRV